METNMSETVALYLGLSTSEVIELFAEQVKKEGTIAEAIMSLLNRDKFLRYKYRFRPIARCEVWRENVVAGRDHIGKLSPIMQMLDTYVGFNRLGSRAAALEELLLAPMEESEYDQKHLACETKMVASEEHKTVPNVIDRAVQTNVCKVAETGDANVQTELSFKNKFPDAKSALQRNKRQDPVVVPQQLQAEVSKTAEAPKRGNLAKASPKKRKHYQTFSSQHPVPIVAKSGETSSNRNQHPTPKGAQAIFRPAFNYMFVRPGLSMHTTPYQPMVYSFPDRPQAPQPNQQQLQSFADRENPGPPLPWRFIPVTTDTTASAEAGAAGGSGFRSTLNASVNDSINAAISNNRVVKRSRSRTFAFGDKQQQQQQQQYNNPYENQLFFKQNERQLAVDYQLCPDSGPPGFIPLQLCKAEAIADGLAGFGAANHRPTVISGNSISEPSEKSPARASAKTTGAENETQTSRKTKLNLRSRQ